MVWYVPNPVRGIGDTVVSKADKSPFPRDVFILVKETIEK